MDGYEDIIAEHHYQEMGDGARYVGCSGPVKANVSSGLYSILRPVAVGVAAIALSTGLTGLLFGVGRANATEKDKRVAGIRSTMPMSEARAVAMAEYEALRDSIEAEHGPPPEDGYGPSPGQAPILTN